MSSEPAGGGGSGGGGGGGSPPQPAGPAPKGLGAGLKPKRKPAGAKPAAAGEAKPAAAVPRLPVPPAPRSEEGQEEVIEIDAAARAYGGRGGAVGFELDLIGDDLDDAFGPGEDDEEGAWESASNASEEMRTLLAAIGKGADAGRAGGGESEDAAAPLLEELFDRGTLLVCGSVLGACAAALVVAGLRASLRSGGAPR